MLRENTQRGLAEGAAVWPTEQIGRFESLQEWREFYRNNRFINDPEYIAMLVNEIRQNGFVCPFSQQQATVDQISIGDPNYREGLFYGSLNSRLRAVVMELLRATAGRDVADLRIFAPEALTSFALLLRGRYVRFVGSEFSTDADIEKKLFPIRFENLLELSFPDEVFDVVLVNDVFEHVPDIDRCLSEIARVTKPGGRLISTFPFNIGNEESVVKARLEDDGIRYLTAPEYHGNPVDPNGSLVFEIPGWNILDRARGAGWSKVEMVYETSVHHGVVSSGFSGIFTLVAIR